MAFECPRRSSPPSPMFDADTGCIATDPAPSARRRFRSKTGIENLPANEHAQETPHTPSPTRTTRRIQSGCAGSRPRLRDGMPGSPSQHIDITRAKWIPYLQYSLGNRIGPFETPPSRISALFLIGEEDWAKWSSWVQANEVGIIAATAPTSALAKRLVNLANGPDTRSALNSLVDAMSPREFNALFETPIDAAGILVEIKPELLYSLPERLREKRRFKPSTTYGQVERSLAFELDVYSWTPFFWKNFVANKIRHSYSERKLIEFVVRRINDRTWEKQSSEIRKFLLKTPHLLDAFLYSDPSIDIIRMVLEEFESLKIRRSIKRTLKKKGTRIDKIAEGLVAFYGAEKELTTNR